MRGAPQVINQPLEGIWFLIRSESGQWDVLTARPSWARTARGLFLPYSPSAATGAYAYSLTASTVDAVVFEVAAAIQLSGETPEAFLDAIDALDSPAIPTVLAAYFASTTRHYRQLL